MIDLLTNYFNQLTESRQTFIIIMMSCIGFIILVLSIKRWLINSKPKEIRKDFNFEKEFVYKNSWLQTLSNLKKEGIKTIALLGGAKLIHSFMMEDLIDEINITIVPKIIGGDYIWLPYNKNEKILNYKQEWIIKSFKQLKTNEIFIHYTKKINRFLEF